MTPSRRQIENVGGLDFHQVGEHLRRLAIELGNLQPHERILDVGCGVGRLAVALTGYLTCGEYTGFDVSTSAIRWCRGQISARYPNFWFAFADVRNGHYNPHGRIAPEQFHFPCAAASVDLVFVASVFTHLLPAAADHYVEEIARVLKIGGGAVVSFFFLDDAIRSHLGTLQPRFVAFPEPYYAVADANDPEAVVAYDLAAVEAAFRRRGLQPTRLDRGVWSGHAGGFTFQDVIVVKKE